MGVSLLPSLHIKISTHTPQTPITTQLTSETIDGSNARKRLHGGEEKPVSAVPVHSKFVMLDLLFICALLLYFVKSLEKDKKMKAKKNKGQTWAKEGPRDPFEMVIEIYVQCVCNSL